MTLTLDPLLFLVLVGLGVLAARKLVKLALFAGLLLVAVRFFAYTLTKPCFSCEPLPSVHLLCARASRNAAGACG